MRIGLVEHDDIADLEQVLVDMRMEIELEPDPRPLPDNRTQPRHEVSFAIIVTIRHHRTMEEHQHRIERPGPPGIIEDAVAHVLIR